MENALIQRVKIIIKNKNLTARSFAKVIDFNYYTLNNYLLGKRDTIDSALPIKIITHYDDISAEWLLTGKGSMDNFQHDDAYLSLEKSLKAALNLINTLSEENELLRQKIKNEK